MQSENAAARFQTHFSRRAPVDGSCLRMESGVAPFPKELGIAGAPRQVYAEEFRHPCYSWVDVRAPRWDWSPDAPCVREIRRECGCVQRWYYPEFPFNGEHVLKVRGQRTYFGHQEWDRDAYNGHCAGRRVSFRHQEERRVFNNTEAIGQSDLSSGKSHHNGTNSEQAAFFPTEVPSSKLGLSGLRLNGAPRETRTSGGGVGLEKHGIPGKSQGTVREQIKQVVTELEEVLGGLKQVQLEMKEVVQQIDILTSNIDLGEDEPSGLSRDSIRSSRTDVVALIHNSNGDEDTSTSTSSLAHSPVTADLHHINSPSPMRNHTNPSPPEQHAVAVEDKGRRVAKPSSETHRKANGSCVMHRTARKVQLENHKSAVWTNSSQTQRPPPYPQNGQVKTRTPPYPGKHKTLSSTIMD